MRIDRIIGFGGVLLGSLVLTGCGGAGASSAGTTASSSTPLPATVSAQRLASTAADFVLAVSPGRVSAEPGKAVTVSVNVQEVGSPGDVVLSLGGSGLLSTGNHPDRIRYYFSPNPVPTGSSGTVTLQVGSRVPAGSYTLRVGGREGDFHHTTTFTLNVGSASSGKGADFALTASPTGVAAEPGKTVTVSVGVKKLGSPGNVTLALGGSGLLATGDRPDRIRWYFSPNPVAAGGFSTLTLKVGAQVPARTYTLKVGGREGDSHQTTTFTLNVGSSGSSGGGSGSGSGGSDSGDGGSGSGAPSGSGPSDGIVYVRIPRSKGSITLSQANYHPGGKAPDGKTAADLWGQKINASLADTLPEVGYIRDKFNAPGQLVWRHSNGKETIIYDCTGSNPAQEAGPPQNGDDTCVPMDPAVSYDGTKVAFAVYHGTYEKYVQLDIPASSGEVGKLDQATWAGIYIYDFKTGALTEWPHKVGVWDMSPVWLPDGDIMFTSTRANIYQQFAMDADQTGLVQQLWIAHADGSDMHDVDPEDQKDALHPFVHSSGRVFYASQHYNEVRLYGEKKEMTPLNEWWMSSVDLRGGDFNAHLRAHRYLEITGVGNTRQDKQLMTAPHFYSELSNGDICFDEYYRQNNFGSGAILCWPATHESTDLAPLGHEGPYTFQHPKGMYVAIPGNNGDDGNPIGGDPHVRDPAGMPNGQLMFSGALGPHAACHWERGGIDNKEALIKITKMGRFCDFGIYISKEIPIPYQEGSTLDAELAAEAVTDQQESTLIVDSPDWDEIMPKPVMPYKEIYGIAKPAQPPLDNSADGSSILAASDAFVGNVTVAGGWQGPPDGGWCQFQGCALQAVPLTQIKAIRFWKAIPNDRPYRKTKPLYDNWGQKLELLGDVPVQSDGSFKAKLPANTPFLMAGVDANGNAIARDQHLMNLQPGEEMTCSGCHLHDPNHAAKVPPFDKTLAFARAAVAPTIPAAEQGVLEWSKDIYPMLKQNCASCHNGKSGSPQPNFAADEQAVFWELLNNDAPAFQYTDAVTLDGQKPRDSLKSMPPWFTRYVNVYFARESLLYWKAAGKRLDGRQDGGTYADIKDNDFEFGPKHPAHLNAQQLKILADWIEAGAYRAASPD